MLWYTVVTRTIQGITQFLHCTVSCEKLASMAVGLPISLIGPFSNVRNDTMRPPIFRGLIVSAFQDSCESYLDAFLYSANPLVRFVLYSKLTSTLVLHSTENSIFFRHLLKVWPNMSNLVFVGSLNVLLRIPCKSCRRFCWFSSSPLRCLVVSCAGWIGFCLFGFSIKCYFQESDICSLLIMVRSMSSCGWSARVVHAWNGRTDWY